MVPSNDMAARALLARARAPLSHQKETWLQVWWAAQPQLEPAARERGVGCVRPRRAAHVAERLLDELPHAPDNRSAATIPVATASSSSGSSGGGISLRPSLPRRRAAATLRSRAARRSCQRARRAPARPRGHRCLLHGGRAPSGARPWSAAHARRVLRQGMSSMVSTAIDSANQGRAARAGAYAARGVPAEAPRRSGAAGAAGAAAAASG